MEKKDYDVIVVGAGPGGSVCAALLAKKGMKTLLVEKNDRPGGKAMTVSNRGYTHELWPITGGPRLNSNFESVLSELELVPEVSTPETYVTLYRKNSAGEYTPFAQPQPDDAKANSPESIMGFLSWLEIQPDEIAALTKYTVETASLTPEQIEDLDNISFHEYLNRYDLPQSLYDYIAAQCNVVFVLPLEQLAASEGIKTMNEMSSQGFGFYHQGGYGRLFERCTETIKDRNGDVVFGARVNQIEVREGKVTGVSTDKGNFTAPIVVSNAGIQPTALHLVGKNHFDDDYTAYIRNLKPSMALIGTRYFLDKKVLDCGFYVAFSTDGYMNEARYVKAKTGWVPDDLMVFMTIPANFDPGLAPEDKQCLLASTPCPPDPEMSNSREWWEKLEEQIIRIWPEIEGHIETREHYGTKQVSALSRDQVLPGIGGECIGLGQMVGQVGRNKPAPASPVDGLFYVGCDAGGQGCGTHQAVTSGQHVADLVLQYFQTKQKS